MLLVSRFSVPHELSLATTPEKHIVCAHGRRGSQVVRHGSAKAAFVGSIPTLASSLLRQYTGNALSLLCATRPMPITSKTGRFKGVFCAVGGKPTLTSCESFKIK